MSKTKLIEIFLDKKIRNLTASENTAAGAKFFADLRRGIGRIPGDLPELWGALLRDMPEELYGTGNAPGNAEWACYISITLFALHQQGFPGKTTPMNVSGMTLGRALKKLVAESNDSGAENRMLEKMRILASAKNIRDTEYYLRSIIQLLKSKGIPLDYPKLGRDLYLLQFNDYAPSVHLNWGRDFYRSNNSNSDDQKGDDSND